MLKRGRLIKATFSIALLVGIGLYMALNHDVQDVIVNLRQISPTALLISVLIAVCVVLVGAGRLFALLRVHYTGMKSTTVIRATILGNLGGLVTIQILGQMVGRQSILRKEGVDPASLAIITLWERAIMLFVGVTGAAIAALTLFRADGFALAADQGMVTVVVVATALILVSHLLFGTPYERDAARSILRVRVLVGSGLAVSFAVLAWFLNLLIFLVLLDQFEPTGPLWQALALCAVISVGAALPISVNGWGTREFLAFLLLPQVGLSPIDAITVSVLVGLVSMAGILVLAPLATGLLKRTPVPGDAEVPGVVPPPYGRYREQSERAFLAILSALLPILLFFQIVISYQVFSVSLNLADPFALLAFCVFLLLFMFRSPENIFMEPVLIRWMMAIWGLLFFGFAVALIKNSHTEWSVLNRLMGWAIIMGYFVAGIAMARIDAWVLGRRAALSLLLSASTILFFDLLYRTLVVSGAVIVSPNAFVSGFHHTESAFGLLVLTSALFSLPFYKARGSDLVSWLHSIGLCLAVVSVLLTGQPVALMALVLAVILSVVLFPDLRADARRLLPLLLLALVPALFLVHGFLGSLLLAATDIDQAGFAAGLAPTAVLSTDTLARALALWRENWFFGGGLGSFLSLHDGDGVGRTIESVWIWALAELGVIGLSLLLAFFGWIAWRAFQYRKSSAAPFAWAVLLILLVFGCFSLTTDVFFQRGFWFLMGFLLATLSFLPSRTNQ